MRLNVNDENVFNKWRELYDDLTDQEQKDFCNKLEEKYPSQKCFTLNFYKYFFKKYGPIKAVFEIGGWKGELAKYCINNNLISHEWVNAELSSNAIEKGFKHKKYMTICPNIFAWFTHIEAEKIDGTCAIASHIIEHLSDKHLIMLIEGLTKCFDLIVFEAPLKYGDNNWHNYLGTHKLIMGWGKINAIMSDKGYLIDKYNNECYIYKKVI